MVPRVEKIMRDEGKIVDSLAYFNRNIFIEIIFNRNEWHESNVNCEDKFVK